MTLLSNKTHFLLDKFTLKRNKSQLKVVNEEEKRGKCKYLISGPGEAGML